MSRTSRTFENDGHMSKLTDEKPVDVMIEATWKNDRRRPWRKPPTRLAMLQAMVNVENPMMHRYTMSSSLLKPLKERRSQTR